MEYDENFLKQNKFTETGIKRFFNTINSFKKELYEKSIEHGKFSKDKDMPLEITSDNVRYAASKINKMQSKQRLHPLIIIANVFEYIFTAVAAIGANNLNKYWGHLLFIICAALTVILITVRLFYNNRS